LFVCLLVCLFICLFACLFVCLLVCFYCLFVCLFLLFVCFSFHLLFFVVFSFVFLFVCIFICWIFLFTKCFIVSQSDEERLSMYEDFVSCSRGEKSIQECLIEDLKVSWKVHSTVSKKLIRPWYGTKKGKH